MLSPSSSPRSLTLICVAPVSSVGTAGAGAVSAPPAPLGLATQPWAHFSLCTRSLCAHARPDFHLVRTQCTVHRAEQDNIDLQSHISGRVVWLLSQDNHVQ